MAHVWPKSFNFLKYRFKFESDCSEENRKPKSFNFLKYLFKFESNCLEENKKKK